jgi:hypothetical protein
VMPSKCSMYIVLLPACNKKPAGNGITDPRREKVSIFDKRFRQIIGNIGPWWRGIESVSRTEDPGFESRQDVSFLGLNRYVAVMMPKLNMQCHFVYLRKKILFCAKN